MAVGRREALRDGIVFEFLYSFFVFFTFKSLSHLEFIQMDSILSYFKHLLKFSFRAVVTSKGGVGGKEETNFLELKVYCVLKVVRVTQVYGFVRTNLAVLVRSVFHCELSSICKVKFYPPKLYKVDLDIFSYTKLPWLIGLYLDCICFIWLCPRLLSV